MSKVLIVYFSMTGMTRKVAEDLAQAGEWDLAQINEPRPRQGRWATFWSGLEAVLGWEPSIAYDGPDPGAYELVILGTPVWASRPASPCAASSAGTRVA